MLPLGLLNRNNEQELLTKAEQKTSQQRLSPAEQQDLKEKFEDIEREVGEDVHSGLRC
jgi:hypothetical protein